MLDRDDSESRDDLRAGEAPRRRRFPSAGHEEAAVATPGGVGRRRGDGGGEFSGEPAGDLDKGDRERKKSDDWARFRPTWVELGVAPAAADNCAELLLLLLLLVAAVPLAGVQLAGESESETWRRWPGRSRALGRAGQCACAMVDARWRGGRSGGGPDPGKLCAFLPSSDDDEVLLGGEEDVGVLPSWDEVRFHLKPEVKI